MSDFSPCPHPFNLAAYVLQVGARTPDKLALSVLSSERVEDWTYGELISAVRGTATGLLQLGLAPGARVLMRLGNTPDFPIAYLAALAAGMVAVPTSAALTEAEVSGLLPKLQPDLILHDPKVPCPIHPKRVSLDELRKMQALTPAPFHMGDPDRPGYIIYTSGTSGRPTAVVHAHRAIWARRMMFDGWYGLQTQDRLLHAGAFNWTYTLGTGLMDPWTIGATALIPKAGTPPSALPELVVRHRASIFAAAPGVYRQMLKGRDQMRLESLRHGLSAGEKMAQPVQRQWESATGTPVFEAFGLSECSTFISGSPARPATLGSIGSPQPGRRVEIMGPAGPVPKGSAGTIAIHRDDPGLMLGYLDDPSQTAAKYQGEWFLTGDQAVMDEAGQVTYLGRDDDMMNAGGFRVSPLEVEAVVATAPGVISTAVASVPVKKDVEVIAAFYTAHADLDEAALSTYVQSKLARYKQPRLYRRVPSLPTGGNGKLKRSALRQDFEAFPNDPTDQA